MEIPLGKKSYRLLFSISVSIILVAYTCYLIYANPDFVVRLQSSSEILLKRYNEVGLYLVTFLMVINWGIEGYKWKVLTRPIIEINFLNSLKSVLIGLAIGFFTPRSIGDYIGRMFFMPTKDKWKLTGALLVGSWGRLLVTLIFGLLGMFLVFEARIQSQLINVIYLTFFSLLCLYVVYLCRVVLLGKLKTWLPRVHKLLRIIRSYSKKEFMIVLFWSALRYLVFTIQFVVVLYLIDPEVSMLGLLPYIWLLYLVKSLAPSINFLTDLGMREATSVYFLGFAGVEPEVALTAGMFIWFLNILVPTFIGGGLVWKR